MRPKVKTSGLMHLPPALGFMRSLWQVNHALERLSARMEERLGITAQQRMLVRLIGWRPGITSAELSQELHLDPGTISISVRRLEKKGLIVRRRSRSDRRVLHLHLSPAGRRLDHPTRATVELAVEGLLTSSPPAAIASTRRVLAELTRRLEAEAER
ncbi:MAG: MarR family transcriptional regulator [Myxococcota bacterium]